MQHFNNTPLSEMQSGEMQLSLIQYLKTPKMIKGGKYHYVPWNSYFNLKKKSTYTSVFHVSVTSSSSTALSISINGGKNSAGVANFRNDACVRLDDKNEITINVKKMGGYSNYYIINNNNNNSNNRSNNNKRNSNTNNNKNNNSIKSNNNNNNRNKNSNSIKINNNNNNNNNSNNRSNNNKRNNNRIINNNSI
ncbi:hypothetical protein H8356DRAFT_1409681 [Neocallimastix lanati (nom. inval.)]|nr:hypothetical protein H8356DRAFT_1409681 [Neocallimastix sp. JGI-2020a]